MKKNGLNVKNQVCELGKNNIFETDETVNKKIKRFENGRNNNEGTTIDIITNQTKLAFRRFNR